MDPFSAALMAATTIAGLMRGAKNEKIQKDKAKTNKEIVRYKTWTGMEPFETQQLPDMWESGISGAATGASIANAMTPSSQDKFYDALTKKMVETPDVVKGAAKVTGAVAPMSSAPMSTPPVGNGLYTPMNNTPASQAPLFPIDISVPPPAGAPMSVPQPIEPLVPGAPLEGYEKMGGALMAGQQYPYLFRYSQMGR
jgi:hypothetical protein